MMEVWQIFVAAGIPSGLFGLLTWYIKHRMKKTEKANERHQEN